MNSDEVQFTKTPIQRSGSLGAILRDLIFGSVGPSPPNKDPRQRFQGWLERFSLVPEKGENSHRSLDRRGRTPKGSAAVAAASFHVNPKFRAYGKARIDIASRVSSQDDWDLLWKESLHPFPFSWGDGWRPCMEYKVDEYAAEVGFFIDVLGFQVNAIGPDYTMFATPDGTFAFGVMPVPPGGQSTPADAVSIRLMVVDLFETTQELERRGVVIEQSPSPYQEGSSLYSGYFRTPNGICIDLWGEVEDESAAAARAVSSAQAHN